MSRKERIVCGLDVGSWKICIALLLVHGNGRLEVIGTGYSSSSGVTKGVIVNLEAAAASIRGAAREAALQSGITADWVTAGISGDHIQSCNCYGTIPIKGRNWEVTTGDMAHVIRAAQSSIPIPVGREAIHVLPQEFILDNRGGIVNPVGLTAQRLDARVHLITCDSAVSQNLINAINRARMRVRKIVLHSIASGEAVLTPDEKEVGAAVVDIGGGTTDIALFVTNSTCFTSVLSVGGANFTRDLVDGAQTSPEEAERVKKEWGSVLTGGIEDDEMITIGGLGTRGARKILRKEACGYLQDRGLELMEFVRDEILRSSARAKLIAGTVLTGGGSTLEGMVEMSSDILEMPVRLGVPQGIDALPAQLAHPSYAGALGLAVLEARNFDGRKERTGIPNPPNPPNSLIDRILSWARD